MSKSGCTISLEETDFRSDLANVIRYETLDDDDVIPHIVEFNDLDTLVLTDLCYDCYEHHYTRIPGP